MGFMIGRVEDTVTGVTSAACCLLLAVLIGMWMAMTRPGPGTSSEKDWTMDYYSGGVGCKNAQNERLMVGCRAQMRRRLTGQIRRHLIPLGVVRRVEQNAISGIRALLKRK